LAARPAARRRDRTARPHPAPGPVPRRARRGARAAAVVGSARAEHAEVIAGSPAACLDALLDFDSYPEWQSAVKSAEVIEPGDDPVVEFRIDAKLKTVRYVLRYHPEPPAEKEGRGPFFRLWWEYVEGDVRSIAGEYALE